MSVHSVEAWQRFAYDFGDKIPVLVWDMGDGETTRICALTESAFEAFADDVDAVLGAAFDAADAADYMNEVQVHLELFSKDKYAEIMESD